MANIFDLFKKIESTSSSTEPISFIIAGLGNPGSKYTFTRHNAGFLALSYISHKENFSINRSKFSSLCTDVTFGGKRCLFMLPQTFMNNSGQALREAADFYKISPENILVIHDDISLDVGVMRIRRKGSDGGQKGMRSIIEHFGTDAFPRIKIGVGKKPHPEMELADWVLSSFPDGEKETLFSLFGNLHEATKLIVEAKIDEAMNKYSR